MRAQQQIIEHDFEGPNYPRRTNAPIRHRSCYLHQVLDAYFAEFPSLILNPTTHKILLQSTFPECYLPAQGSKIVV